MLGAQGTDDVVATLADLVRRPSVNPMGREVAGPEYLERRVGDYLAQRFTVATLPWARQTVAPGRDNIVARLEATVPDAPTLLWDAHQDTVPVEGMTIDPFTPVVRDGRLYGRGACDVKGGMAAMLVAIDRLRRDPRPRRFTVVFSATINEEFGFSGARALVSLWEGGAPGGDAARAIVGGRPAAAVVAEPTDLTVVTTHKGAVRWRVLVHGRSCHSAFPEQGENAIYHAGRVILAVERLALELRSRFPGHPCGPPSLSLGTIRGGVGVNLVPDRVTLEIDRRLLPGESAEEARREVIDAIAATPSSEWIEHQAPFLQSVGLPDESERPVLAGRSPGDLMRRAAAATGRIARSTAARYGTNASVLGAAGVPALVFGPGSILQAHTADEWIDLSEVEAAAAILVELVVGTA